MTRFKKHLQCYLFRALLVLFFQTTVYAAPSTVPQTPVAAKLNQDQTVFYLSIYKDAWSYLSTFVEEMSGLPYDSSARQPATSMANVGYYLASTTIAYRTNLISKEEALARVSRVLDALDKIEKWRGFPMPWVLVRTLKPTYGEEFSYGPHLSVLVGGLVVTKNAFPEIADRISKMMVEMKFKDLYDRETGWLKGGYNTKNQNFAIYQPWGHWYYKYFASETRLLSFYGIATRLIPKTHWASLIRPSQEAEGETFFVTGTEEAGLGPQYVTGLFLDERNSEMGRSQKNYALYQIKLAKQIKAPVWGWTSAQSPSGRYLGYGEMRNEIVAPHASALASVYLPEEAYENLKKLEKLGARSVSQPSDPAAGFGFRDSINWKTGSVARDYFTLSEGMTFLSLANLLYDGIVWQTFQMDPIVERGLAALGPAVEITRQKIGEP